MEIELLDDKDEETVIESLPEVLSKAQLAAVGLAVARAVGSLDIRELIRDSVQDTVGGMKRRLRTSGKEKR